MQWAVTDLRADEDKCAIMAAESYVLAIGRREAGLETAFLVPVELGNDAHAAACNVVDIEKRPSASEHDLGDVGAAIGG